MHVTQLRCNAKFDASLHVTRRVGTLVVLKHHQDRACATKIVLRSSPCVGVARKEGSLKHVNCSVNFTWTQAAHTPTQQQLRKSTQVPSYNPVRNRDRKRTEVGSLSLLQDLGFFMKLITM